MKVLIERTRTPLAILHTAIMLGIVFLTALITSNTAVSTQMVLSGRLSEESKADIKATLASALSTKETRILR